MDGKDETLEELSWGPPTTRSRSSWYCLLGLVPDHGLRAPWWDERRPRIARWPDPLWTKSFDLLSTTDRWLIGFGYGSPRVFLPTIASWAGTAHSSWMELLLGIGILGPILAAADILFVIWYAASRNALVPPSVTLSILTFLLVTSVTGEGLALPSASFAILALLHAPDPC